MTNNELNIFIMQENHKTLVLFVFINFLLIIFLGLFVVLTPTFVEISPVISFLLIFIVFLLTLLTIIFAVPSSANIIIDKKLNELILIKKTFFTTNKEIININNIQKNSICEKNNKKVVILTNKKNCDFICKNADDAKKICDEINNFLLTII